MSALVGVFWGLQKAGVDVGRIIREFLGIRSVDDATQAVTGTRETLAAIQAMTYQMGELTNHFNHETTSELVEIKDTQKQVLELLQQGNEILRAIDKYGIRCRKD